LCCPMMSLSFSEDGLVGVIHLAPLPGSPEWVGDMDDVLKQAVRDARSLTHAGFDAMLVENFGDTPFHPDRVEPVTVAAMSHILSALRAEFTDSSLGVNVLRNDVVAALSLAAVHELEFIRVNVHVGERLTDQGRIQGRAAETLRMRRDFGLDVAILADVGVKHALPVNAEQLAFEASHAAGRGGASALIVTGMATGAGVNLKELDVVRSAAPEAPIILGSGLGLATPVELMQMADGAIVGSSIREDGRAGSPVDEVRAAEIREFWLVAREIPSASET